MGAFLLAKDTRRHVAERLVGAFFVVGDHPVMNDVADLGEGVKEVGIENFPTEGSIEAFDISILGWLAGLDVMKPHAVGFGPGKKRGRSYNLHISSSRPAIST